MYEIDLMIKKALKSRQKNSKKDKREVNIFILLLFNYSLNFRIKIYKFTKLHNSIMKLNKRIYQKSVIMNPQNQKQNHKNLIKITILLKLTLKLNNPNI